MLADRRHNSPLCCAPCLLPESQQREGLFRALGCCPQLRPSPLCPRIFNIYDLNFSSHALPHFDWPKRADCDSTVEQNVVLVQVLLFATKYQMTVIVVTTVV